MLSNKSSQRCIELEKEVSHKTALKNKFKSIPVPGATPKIPLKQESVGDANGKSIPTVQRRGNVSFVPDVQGG